MAKCGLSLVLLSWMRIDNVMLLANRYLSYPIVREIFIFNNNPKFDLEPILPQNDKLTLIQSTQDLGLNTRFAAASLCASECIFFTDDDILIPDRTLETLFEEWKERQDSCHGIVGRDPIRGYNTRDVYGDVKIVLTRCLLTSRSICIKALYTTLSFQHLESIPKGNGEDIIISYTSIMETGSYNRVYKLAYENLPGHRGPEGSSDAIHQRFNGHYQHRQCVINLCEDLLASRKSVWRFPRLSERIARRIYDYLFATNS